ncbi:protein arginine N-methyltransferase 5 [Histomonas meleagridis]|uniref:protein arginine N-methyltransferase 5 n=1 Tax=Histomonas meleagridis TaxID=135588 RepID=UPI00355949E4|nr:protein arginine N-methyltransferase 5 [Histomonas meleagridis]KAH0804298.1 protein arginine N-methyltransferase 5 [Histomonas meleagridis]
MTNFGIICRDLKEYQILNPFISKITQYSTVFPYDVVKSALYTPILSNTRTFPFLAVEVDISKDEQIDLSHYLSAAIIFFRPNLNDLFESASNALRQINRYQNLRFSALLNDFSKWNEFAELCGHPPTLFVSPELPNNILELSLWGSTHIFSVSLSSSHFLPDFTLPIDLSLFIKNLFERCIPVFLPASVPNFPNLFATIYSVMSATTPTPFVDIFRPPMETVTCDLPSLCYEEFEEDQVKYEKYQLAIEKAIKSKGDPSALFVAVVGAGRGPLVDCALKAGAVNIFVIEKNRSVFQFLEMKKTVSWPGTVQLFCGEMRSIELPHKVDILISELLGGFGDNELCPECLEGCERFLNKNAISVPKEYTSFLVPLMSQHLWTKALFEMKQQSMLVIPLAASVFISEPSSVFKFSHPGKNELYQTKMIKFNPSLFNGMCNGFGGWFEATLFDDVVISSSPINGTLKMISWMPVYFPLEQAVNVKEGECISIMFSRKSDGNAVWYEWSMVSPEYTSISNGGGRIFSFGLK